MRVVQGPNDGTISVEETKLAGMRFHTVLPVTHTGLPVATVGDAGEFNSGREMAAWLGLVPRQRSTGGRSRLLGISKRGYRYLMNLID